MVIGDPITLTTIVILAGHSLSQTNQQVLLPEVYLPNMFKRMRLGLLCCLLKVIMEISLQATQEIYTAQKCSNETHCTVTSHSDTSVYVRLTAAMVGVRR